MADFFQNLNPVLQALIAGIFTWGVTSIGASSVFFFSRINRKLLDSMLGFAAGVMIAASFWSLLAPAIDLSEGQDLPSWIPPTVGFLSGAVFLYVLDKILPHLHLDKPLEQAEGIKTKWERNILLVSAITLHNIPEGLAVGVAFGAAAAGLETASLSAAIVLAVGIGLQNFPEGVAVSMPLRSEGLSKFKSFNFGQLSAIVEPIAAVIGAAFVLMIRSLLPYALSFAAGAMIFVVVEELIPESHSENNTDIATISAMVGFTIMMILDVSLG